MAVFATVGDYTARYGETADEGRLEVLLQDASNLLAAAFEDALGVPCAEGVCAAFDLNAAAVCCLVVNRVLVTPDAFLGATSYSQAAGGYSASISYGSALGEMYLGKSDLKRLGLGRQRLTALHPIERGAGCRG